MSMAQVLNFRLAPASFGAFVYSSRDAASSAAAYSSSQASVCDLFRAGLQMFALAYCFCIA